METLATILLLIGIATVALAVIAMWGADTFSSWRRARRIVK
jgi:hypothetical protein